MLTRIPPFSPVERRARAARILAMRQNGQSYARIGRAFAISPTRARQIVRKAGRPMRDPRWYDPLPARAVTFLHCHTLATLPEAEAAAAVARLSRRELLSASNGVGKATAAALAAWLARHGLELCAEEKTA
jgi:hypothetical protein